ncbi:MAG: Crp/Fnr family transcriptional regulator [Leptospiraceae bacterium]|nr:Crp/Fnr family transcriptional regulator [Leptospiraceae bacterium]
MLLPESLFEKFGTEFEAGQIIFCEYEPGTDCYFIQEGQVKITKTVSRNQKTLDIIGPGDFFGEMAILEEEPRSASAIAVDDVRALRFKQENFDSLMNSIPQLAFQLLKIFAHRIFDQRRRLQILIIDEPQPRIADVFLMLAEKDKNYGHTNQLTFPITVEDVAAWAGMAPAETQRVVSAFVNQGKLELFADRVVIKNINDFKRMVANKRKTLE